MFLQVHKLSKEDKSCGENSQSGTIPEHLSLSICLLFVFEALMHDCLISTLEPITDIYRFGLCDML